jgi:hypothetical protein
MCSSYIFFAFLFLKKVSVRMPSASSILSVTQCRRKSSSHDLPELESNIIHPSCRPLDLHYTCSRGVWDHCAPRSLVIRVVGIIFGSFISPLYSGVVDHRFPHPSSSRPVAIGLASDRRSLQYHPVPSGLSRSVRRIDDLAVSIQSDGLEAADPPNLSLQEIKVLFPNLLSAYRLAVSRGPEGAVGPNQSVQVSQVIRLGGNFL